MFDKASILITGGTGSFGQHCVRTILKRYRPRRLIVFSRDEFKQYTMQQEFRADCMRYFLGDVRDIGRLHMVMQDVDYVIHAAALKQVDALEYNPWEAIETNIRGSQNVITAAMEHGVKKVIGLSTDKATSPINLYGATKLVADKLFVAMNNARGKRATLCSVVRYGNVVGSRGSVLPLFLKMKAEGRKSLPITDPRMTRFWITVDQGVDFVLKCFERMAGGETFVPKLPSIRITDLARAVMPQGTLKTIGIRPGEKLHEVLCPQELSRQTLEFKDHYVIMPSFVFVTRPDYAKNPCGEKGRLVKEGFEYSSLTNPDYLSGQAIKRFLASDMAHAAPLHSL